MSKPYISRADLDNLLIHLEADRATFSSQELGWIREVLVGWEENRSPAHHGITLEDVKEIVGRFRLREDKLKISDHACDILEKKLHEALRPHGFFGGPTSSPDEKPHDTSEEL